MTALLGIAAVAIGGALGAMLRYLLEAVGVMRWGTRWPYGTFLANMIGSALLGTLTGLAYITSIPAEVKLFIGMGLCGALTTFSSFALQMVELPSQHVTIAGTTPTTHSDSARWVRLHGVAYAAVSVLVGLICAGLVLIPLQP